MNYQLIKSEEELDKFINFLPDTDENFRYYITLLARKKYDPTGIVKADRSQLKRVVAKKEDIKSKIRQMETAVGTYTEKGQSIPQESLALYITPNPRSLKKAGLKLLKEIADKISREETFNPSSLSMNCIQTSSDNARWFDLDVDIKTDALFSVKHEGRGEFFSKVTKVLGEDNYKVISTRGGWHILVELLAPNLPKHWYQEIQKLKTENIDIMMNGKDALVPVVGCVQGNTSPRLYVEMDFKSYISRA